jgi:hypothetical protein
LVDQYRWDDFSELLARVEASHQALIDFLRHVPAHEFLRRSSVATLLRAESRDEEEHLGQLESLRKS